MHSHSARVTCKVLLALFFVRSTEACVGLTRPITMQVMAILSVKRGKKQTKRALREVRMGEGSFHTSCAGSKARQLNAD